MKILLDNNVVLDAAVSRKPFNDAAERIIRLIGDGKLDGYITANSATDIFYVLRKMSGLPEARTALSNMLLLFNVVSVSGGDCVNALALPIPDFEDALISECATKISAGYIVSRDRAFLESDSRVKVIAPGDFLDLL